MITSQLSGRPVELPGMPDKRSVNVSQTGEPTEYYFEKRYGEYRDVPYYEEAKQLFLHKRINGKNECGVNTLHEQLLAGRITPKDVRVIGYTNLAYFKTFIPMFLQAMTDPWRMMDALTVRAIMDAARNSYQYNRRSEEKSHPQVAINKTYFLGYHFGADVVRSLHNHTGICDTAKTLMKLNVSDSAKALEVIGYIESYYDEMRPLLAGHDLPESFYRDNDFFKLMEAGVTPKQAAEGTVQGLSAERAVEAINISTTLAKGVL